MNTRQMCYHTKDGVMLKSYLALPEEIKGPVPCVIVAPEWWGLSEHPKRIAERLAAEGYVALAIDVYGEGITTDDPGEAGHRMNELLDNPKELLERALAGSKQLHDLPETCRDRMGAVGFCFGGKIVLDMARSGLKLKAVATFHGNLATSKRAQPGDIKAELLIAHGGDDTMVTMDVVEDFKKEMDAAGVSYDLDIYEGAKHGFTNPKIDEQAEQNDLDLAYNAAATEKSWQKMLEFFERTLKA